MKHRGLMALMLAACMLMLCVATAAADYEVNGKTIAVSGGGTAIQDAIDYIKTQEDRTGWTIGVAAGTYKRFTVPHYNKSRIENLVIEGASEESVTVNVLNETYTESALIDNGGINIYGKNVTLRNMTIKAGAVKQAWDDAAISTSHGMSGGADVILSVENCTLIGPGIGRGATYGVFWACEGLEVNDCTISGFANAIEYMNDGFNVPAGKTYEFTGNTINGASFAFHGYMGGGNGGGKILFAGNTVTGTTDLYSKVIAQDNVKDSFRIEIRDNVFENVIMGLVNLLDSGDVNDVLDENTLVANCFCVEAIEPGTIEFYTVYQAPEGTKGYWGLTGIDDFDVDWGKNPDGSMAYIKEAVDKANAERSNKLSITGIDADNLIKTFTWFKDGIYWYDRVGDLKIAKTVGDKKTDGEFAFSVTLSDKTISGTYGDLTFKNGVASFTLTHNRFVLAQNLPEGISYTVVEEDPGAYTAASTGSTGTIRKGETAVCEFVNEPVSVAGLPSTGDDSHMALWLGCMALSLAAIAAAARRRRAGCE